MTVPSREEVARAVSLATDDSFMFSRKESAHVLDAIARTTVNGEPLRIVIGTTHEECETCDESGVVPYWTNGFFERLPEPCPDGRPVYWTVSDD